MRAASRWHYWPADVHFVGKDIIRFHAVYWPAFLMAAGLPVPKRVTSNGWWVVDGEKMSKSLGNVIEPRKLAETFGLDQIRYFLLREKPFGADGSLSHAAIISRINVELANDLGNLAQRSLSLIARNCGGALPGRGTATEDDTALLVAANALPELLRGHMDRQTFHEALEEVWKVIRAANGYIDRQAPWALNRTDKVPHGGGAAGAGRYAAGGRNRAAAVHARQHGADAGSARRSGRGARVGRSGHTARGRAPAAAHHRVCFPAMWSRRREARTRTGSLSETLPVFARGDTGRKRWQRGFAFHATYRPPPPRDILARRKGEFSCAPTGNTLMLIDSHCHLDYFTPMELPAVLARAAEAGVGEMVTIGTTLEQSRRLPALIAGHSNLWCTVGVHPHHAAEAPIPTPETLAEMAQASDGLSASANPVWTTSTTARRATFRRRISARISAAPGWPACRWQSTRATPTTISP